MYRWVSSTTSNPAMGPTTTPLQSMSTTITENRLPMVAGQSHRFTNTRLHGSRRYRKSNVRKKRAPISREWQITHRQRTIMPSTGAGWGPIAEFTVYIPIGWRHALSTRTRYTIMEAKQLPVCLFRAHQPRSYLAKRPLLGVQTLKVGERLTADNPTQPKAKSFSCLPTYPHTRQRPFSNCCKRTAPLLSAFP